MRVLLVGWFSFEHGEATAGDVASGAVVARGLARAGIEHDIAWSPVFRPGALSLDSADPSYYTHLVFVCGPLHGWQVEWLHERFRGCFRLAVGVSVIAPRSRAVTGFDVVLARDGAGGAARPDLALAAPPAPALPVVGLALATRQEEYGRRGRHEEVTEGITSWLARRDAARVPLSTRLDSHDWRHAATPEQLAALLGRLDLLVTTRLHGLVFALRSGTPVIAVDPVAGGAKVSAQARALDWPAALAPRSRPELESGLARHWQWCLSPVGRERAAGHAAVGRGRADAAPGEPGLLRDLLRELGARPVEGH